MEYFVTFLEGLITFISPCFLPMLPIYLSYLAGGRDTEQKSRTLINALGFILGFTLMFLLMGAFAGSIGMLLKKYQTAVHLISGALVILFGLNTWTFCILTFLRETRNSTRSPEIWAFFRQFCSV